MVLKKIPASSLQQELEVPALEPAEPEILGVRPK